MPNVYVLLSLKDHKTYTGSTDVLSKRLKEHSDGKVITTRHRHPLKLIYTEKYQRLEEARKRERYFKTASVRRKLKMILKNLNDAGWRSSISSGS